MAQLLSKATLYGDSNSPISWISFVDVARFAVMAVDSPAARNTILELGGPDKVSPNDAVKIFEECSGQQFQVEYVPVEALQAQRANAEDPLQQSFAANHIRSEQARYLEATGSRIGLLRLERSGFAALNMTNHDR